MDPFYAALMAELALPKYIGVSDDDAAAMLNARDKPVARLISADEFKARLIELGHYGKLQVLEGSADAANIKAAADLGQQTIDVNTPGIKDVLAQLAGGGVMSVADKDVLIALGTELKSRAEILGLTKAVTPGRVIQAREYLNAGK